MPKRTLAILSTLLLTIVLAAAGCIGPQTGPPPSEVNSQGVINVTPRQAYDLIEQNRNNPDFVIIDVRPVEYYTRGYIAGAVNISLDASDISKFQNKLSGLSKNKTYLTYCPDGCGAAANMMKDLGFEHVYDIKGGLSQWLAEGLPIVE